MRIYEIDDSYELFEKGIRMGARDLNKASGQGRTIGFEFEVSVPAPPGPMLKKDYEKSIKLSTHTLIDFIKSYQQSFIGKISPKYGFCSEQDVHMFKFKKRIRRE